MFTLLFIVLPSLVYFLTAVQMWRHLGWWARNNYSGCMGNDCHIQYPSLDDICSHCDHNLCFISAIWDYGWTFLASLIGWVPILLTYVVISLVRKYDLTKKNIGFFKPAPIVESQEKKIARLESERKQREAYIAKLEKEAGLPIDPPEEERYTKPWAATTPLRRF